VASGLVDGGRIGGPPRAQVPLEAAFALAEQYRIAGRLSEAEALCRDILASWPNQAGAIHLLGILAYQRGDLAGAVEQLEQAVKHAPHVSLFHANLGEMHRLSGHPERAIAAARRALVLQPNYPEVLSNLGIALYEQKKFSEAADAHRRAIGCKPDFALAHSNLGNALFALKHFKEAAAAHRRALELDPRFVDAWSNLGTTLHHDGLYNDAVGALRQAITLAPDHANARSGLGILLLMHGDFAQGWDEYEWRLKSNEAKVQFRPQRPWNGESLVGRHIHVLAEQGFGDTLQFVRFLPRLTALAETVSLRVQAELTTLMRESLPGIEVLGEGEVPSRPPDFDCILLSLPRLFHTRPETIPAKVPYLFCLPASLERWRERLASMPGLKAGIVWAGNAAHANDFRRSLPFAALSPLFSVAGASFASLQVGPRARDRKTRGAASLVDLSGKLTDFAETAAAIMALDLVIAVDTSVAHLAGALGKPVWLLLPTVTDWRWLLNREDSPWYPTMRLFRQIEGETWRDVIARVTQELAAVAQGDLGRLAPFQAQGELRARIAAEATGGV
jgi:tetratricopeptide (TPR) repeat protein